jgi:hypothetical protein
MLPPIDTMIALPSKEIPRPHTEVSILEGICGVVAPINVIPQTGKVTD